MTAEDRLQAGMVKWFDYQYPKMRKLLFSVPNGGNRSITGARTLKATGVRAGVSDLIFLSPDGVQLIEVKTTKGKQSVSQKEWQHDLTQAGYSYSVVRSLDEFMELIKSSLGK